MKLFEIGIIHGAGDYHHFKPKDVIIMNALKQADAIVKVTLTDNNTPIALKRSESKIVKIIKRDTKFNVNKLYQVGAYEYTTATSFIGTIVSFATDTWENSEIKLKLSAPVKGVEVVYPGSETYNSPRSAIPVDITEVHIGDNNAHDEDTKHHFNIRIISYNKDKLCAALVKQLKAGIVKQSRHLVSKVHSQIQALRLVGIDHKEMKEIEDVVIKQLYQKPDEISKELE